MTSTEPAIALHEGAYHSLAVLQAENRILELATRNTPLPAVLNALALSAEQLAGEDTLCSILLLDVEGRRLLHGAAPNLPAAYNAAIHGIEIGPSVGSCGTAAATRTEVVVSDIATHPFWAPFKDLALSHGLRACWSTPIFSSQGAVLGTFAMYFRHPAEPDAPAREIVQVLARTAALVLERARLNDDLNLKIAQHQKVEDLLRTAQEAAGVATWSWDAAEDALSFAAGSAEILPIPLAGITTRQRLLDLMRQQDRVAVAQVFRQAIQAQSEFKIEFCLPHGGGSRWILMSGRALPAEHRLSTSAVGVCIDITERKEAELQLLASRESFRRAQEAANIGSWTWDIATGKVEYAAEVPTLRGFQGDFNDWLARIIPEDRERTRQGLQRAFTGGELNIESRIRINPEDPPRWILSSGRVETLDGKPVSAAGITMDITERRQAEADRQLTEERFRLVLESSDVGFWYCDLPFQNLEWDDKVKEHFWFPRHHRVTIDDFYARLHPDDREPTRNAIELSNREDKPYDIDYRTVNPETGEWKFLRAVGRTTRNDAGDPIRFDGITIDFTERKRAEDALRASEKLAATGRLAATIAHEINNPLEAVTNYIYLAKNAHDVPPKVKRYLEVADGELARVSHIAQQTLGFYRDTSHPARVDVTALLDDILLLYERKMGYKNLEIVKQYPASLHLFGLAGELRQVISNLIANALDASRDEGRIYIRAKSTLTAEGQRQITVTIADQGCGMPPDVQERIFTPFFTTKLDVGTGLGLWVSRGIVEKHRGSLRFRSSTGDRSGTVFRITLPAGAVGAASRSNG